MQWKAITTNLGHSAYSLWNDGRKLLTLDYKSQSNRVYVKSEDGERRSFRYRRKGLLKNKVVLENEYGTDLGKLRKDKNGEYILIDDQSYYLNYKSGWQVEIVPKNADEPLAVCKMEIDRTTNNTYAGLLMVVCYYLLGHPQHSEKLTLAV